MRLRYLGTCVVTAATGLTGVTVARPAAADCNYSGSTTLWASGDVRGSSGGAPTSSTAPYSPYPCYDYAESLCLAYDNYDPGVIFDPRTSSSAVVTDPEAAAG